MKRLRAITLRVFAFSALVAVMSLATGCLEINYVCPNGASSCERVP